MAIKIKRNEAGNCIEFQGSSNPVYWNACLSGQVDSTDNTLVNIINDIKTAQAGSDQYEFFRIPYTEFLDEDGLVFANAQEVADYVTLKGNVAASEDINVGYKGVFDASTNADPTDVSPVNGDWYYIGTEGTINTIEYKVNDIIKYSESTTSWERIENKNATVQELEDSALDQYDIHVDGGYTGTIRNGSSIYPYNDLSVAIAASNEGDTILIKGDIEVPNSSSDAFVLPHSLHFYGADESEIKFTTYDSLNGDLFYFQGTDNSQNFSFKNLVLKNAGGYALHIKKTSKVVIEDCRLENNGWNGLSLNTVLSSAVSGLLGYDSTNTELQAFYAGVNASNGGATRIEEATQLLVIGNTVTKNLRGIRVSDCGINGGGVISRNQSTQNIESGIYLSVGSLGGCQNVTVTMNVSSYNANNGLLVIGGLNNKFSQNEVNGNWNAGFCAWGAANTTLRDCGLYDNNRSEFNGIGNTGDAKASIQINEAYNLLGTSISLNPNFRFIAEILDTQVHYTGLGSNTEKIGFLITSAVGQLADNAKNIIKVDDVGFIGQDYAIDLSEVDVTNLRLSFGDNSYQSIGLKAVKAPLSGKYSELPFSNHVMEVPEVDVVVDTLKQTIALHEGVGGNVINVYSTNELQSVLKTNSVDIIQKSSDKIQLRDLTLGNVYINGVAVGNSINSVNDSLNAAFNMSLIEYKDFLVSEVGVNGDASSGGSLPAIANNWYVSYGSQSGTQITQAIIGNDNRNLNPFYNGETLEKGHEFVWTHNPTVGYIIGIWGAAEAPQAGTDALQPSNWTVGFAYASTNTRFSQIDSSGVTIEQSGSFAGYYGMPNGQLAIRFGQDNYLYLYEIVSGGYSLIGKSNSTVAGASVMIQWASFNQGSFPVMTERTETWEIVADEDNSQNGEWSGGLEESTVIKSRMSFSPNEKITMDFNHFGRMETIGFDYNGTATGQAGAENLIPARLFYNTSEILKSQTDNGVDWNWNLSATNIYNPNGDGTDIGYDTGNNLGLISFRYKSDNTLELWHETNNELMATKVIPFDGSAQHIFFGANENNHTADRIPLLTKYDMSAAEVGAELTGWWYIESPDGNFEYPLFASEAEANYIDSVEGGAGTSSSITYADDLSGNTWYYPTTSFVNNGTTAPQGGVFGNSINVVWNEQGTGEDASYAPTFTDIVYTIQEGSVVNIQYKAAGMTDTFNVTNVPSGYADNGFAIIGTAETITDGVDIQHVINVTKANDFGSDTGTITLNVTDDPTNNVSQNLTPWTKAIDFSGGNEHLLKVNTWTGSNPLLMDSISQVLAGPSTVGNTTNASSARPWATAIVFDIDNVSSNQHIWNSGEGAANGADNIYLRVNASKHLIFGWGREGSGYNECTIFPTPSQPNAYLGHTAWYGVYIGYNGTRLSGSNATAANLADCFDIRLMNSAGNNWTLGSNLSVAAAWTSTGARMDRAFTGYFTVGGRASNRNFNGQVASMVVTTLRLGVAMPTNTEIEMMITDPRKWEDDYRIGQTVRRSQGSSDVTYSNSSVYNGHGGTQIWLMGDSYIDSYANGIRNDVYHADQNYGKLQFNSMQSNDIVNVNIPGLS